jgi:hypothetical protein
LILAKVERDRTQFGDGFVFVEDASLLPAGAEASHRSEPELEAVGQE